MDAQKKALKVDPDGKLWAYMDSSDLWNYFILMATPSSYLHSWWFCNTLPGD